jgi:CRP/FNR family transcriptional regulator
MPSSCSSCPVRHQAICADLEPDELRELRAIGRHKRLPKGKSLLWEGDASVMVANVLEGDLALTHGTLDGREQIVGVASASDFTGRPFGPTTPYGARALSDVQVCAFPRDGFDAFALRHPKFAQRLLERTLRQLDRTRRWMTLLGRKDADERLASFLLDINKASNERSGRVDEEIDPRIELPFSRQQIADVLGLTIETVSRHFTRLRKDGVIHLPSRRAVIIRDRAALEALAN